MHSLLLAAAAAAASPAPAPAAAAPLDLRCFRLMAELADAEDPRIRSIGRIAAQYFLGRIDAAAPGAELGEVSAPPQAEPRGRLLRQCGDAMQAGGRDFRTIGEALAPPSTPAT
ncbi:MAG TPA: hypothetical protein VGX37_07365 [Allosphingosinicella sp.]|jgi:hypothetical protein|nr:hypothetical protein [Allosphingosinicella sp.]